MPNFAIPQTKANPEPRAFSAGRTLLGLMLFAAPLPFGGVFTWAWASLSILTLAVLVLWMVGSLRTGKLRIGWSPLFPPLALFLALGLIQLCFHRTLAPIETKEALLKLATDLLLFFVVIQVFATCPVEGWLPAAVAVPVYGFLLSFLSILQFLWNPGRILWVGHDLGGPFGPYVDHDHYAGLMEMIIPFSACSVLSRPRRDPLNGLFWFAVVIQSVSLLLTGSRGGFISVLAETAILGSVLLKGNPPASGRKRALTTGLALVAVAVIFFWLVPPFVLAKLGTARNYLSEQRVGRVTLWKSSLKILWKHPLAGTGLGTFAVAYPACQTEPSDLLTEHAHNDYLEALTETGLAGGILILWALAVFLAVAFGNLEVQLGHAVGWLQLGAAIACCGLLVHSFVDFNLHIPANAAWFAFFAGLASLAGRMSLPLSPGGDAYGR